MAHTTDVDAMLDRMTPEQFTEWEAMDQIEPIGYSTQLLGLIAWLLHSYMASDPVDAEKLMPWLKDTEVRPQNRTAKQILGAI